MTVTFVGHRKIFNTEELKKAVYSTAENLIVNDNATTFLFGSKSDFDSLCYDAVCELKNTYSDIKRVYVRAEYEFISDDYKNYLLSLYEDTFFPAEVHNAGALSYIKRNNVMIDMCDVLIAYCNPFHIYTKSGTLAALHYAQKKNKRIIDLFRNLNRSGDVF